MVDDAVAAAERAFDMYSELPPQKVAAFLDRIAEDIVAVGDSLIATASEETGLPADRLNGERTRTLNQIRLFADVARKGEWKDVRIDPRYRIASLYAARSAPDVDSDRTCRCVGGQQLSSRVFRGGW